MVKFVHYLLLKAGVGVQIQKLPRLIIEKLRNFVSYLLCRFQASLSPIPLSYFSMDSIALEIQVTLI